MPSVTVRNVPAEVHRALRVRAALHGHSIEAEMRAMLEAAVKPQGRIRLGSLLTEIGRQAQLSDAEFALFERTPGRSPARAAGFE